MISYEALRQNPQLFKPLSGITLTQFEDLLTKLEPIWIQANYDRLNRPHRKRSVGGGPNHKLKLADRLLMTLMLLHLQLNTDALGTLFDVNKSTVSRNTRQILLALRHLETEKEPWPPPPQRGTGKSLSQIVAEYPDLASVFEKRK